MGFWLNSSNFADFLPKKYHFSQSIPKSTYFGGKSILVQSIFSNKTAFPGKDVKDKLLANFWS
jgi:hypothetical protein